jgi:hypothetical protein
MCIDETAKYPDDSLQHHYPILGKALRNVAPLPLRFRFVSAQMRSCSLMFAIIYDDHFFVEISDSSRRSMLWWKNNLLSVVDLSRVSGNRRKLRAMKCGLGAAADVGRPPLTTGLLTSPARSFASV